MLNNSHADFAPQWSLETLSTAMSAGSSSGQPGIESTADNATSVRDLSGLIREWNAIMRELQSQHASSDHRAPLAALAELLRNLDADSLGKVAGAPPMHCSEQTLNWIAAMVEEAAVLLHCCPPAWTGHVEPLTNPLIMATHPHLRIYLLAFGHPAYKRRNIYALSGIEARV